MAKYSSFKYGSGVKYGGALGVINLYKLNLADPSNATKPRHIKTTIKYTTGALWTIATIRLLYARSEHVIPKYYVPVNRRIKRTKVTLKYTTGEFWAVDSIRLVQRIANQGPSV